MFGRRAKWPRSLWPMAEQGRESILPRHRGSRGGLREVQAHLARAWRLLPTPQGRQVKWGFSTFTERADPLSRVRVIWCQWCLSPARTGVSSCSSSSQQLGPGAHRGDLKLLAGRKEAELQGSSL